MNKPGKRETVGDIAAEIRQRWHGYIVDGDGLCDALTLADRIDAAAERERDELRREMGEAESSERFAMCARCDKRKRNCDLYTTEQEARDVFDRAYFGPTEPDFAEPAFVRWLFASTTGDEQ